MEKDYAESKVEPTGPTDSSNHAYGESETLKPGLYRRIFDSFKEDPNAHVTTAISGSDVENAATNTASSPLHRRLKSRHLQMIAIGGSIGTKFCRLAEQTEQTNVARNRSLCGFRDRAVYWRPGVSADCIYPDWHHDLLYSSRARGDGCALSGGRLVRALLNSIP